MKLYTEEQVKKAIDIVDSESIYKISTYRRILNQLTPIELPTDKEVLKVKAIQDESGHWYIIPNEVVAEFRKDELNEGMCDSGKFYNKWGIFMTGGDLNLVQLYVKKEQFKQQSNGK